MKNTKSVGDVAETQTLAGFTKLGIPVLIPFGDNQPYDLVIDLEGELLRVQCKTGRLRRGAIEWKHTSVVAGKRVPHTPGSVDLWAVFCWETKEVYVLREHQTSNLRVEPTKNKQSKGVVWARNHALENFHL